MSDEDPLLRVQLATARIEATLEGLKNQSDSNIRNAEQIVQLIREQFMAELGVLRRDMADLKAVQLDTDETVKVIDRWRLTVTNRAIGIAVGATLGTSGLTAALVKALA